MRRLIVLFYNIILAPYRLFFTKISPLVILQNSKVDKKAALCKNTRFYRSSIGKYSYVGGNSFVTNTCIGCFTSISSDCYIGGTSHPMSWVSTSPVFHKWENLFHKNFSRFEYDIFLDTKIGNDVWIGENVKIKAGITIGDGSIIGMGSVVVHDVPPYEIWAGNPARKIRDRFDNDMKKKLQKIKWWTWEDSIIEKASCFFDSPERLIEHVNNETNND